MCTLWGRWSSVGRIVHSRWEMNWFTYLLNFRAVVKSGNHGVEEKFIITGGEDLQRGGHQGDWVDNFATLCRWKGFLYDNDIYDIYSLLHLLPQVRLMPRKKVGEGFALVGRDTGPGKDCLWYGTTFCDGDLVEDLFRWWFRMKCSKSKFTVASVPYTQVVQDPRFKP